MKLTHPRLAPRGSRPGTWWGKAWARTLEEATYGADELRRGRRLARDGAVGAIEIDAGGYVAAVEERQETYTVSGTVEPFDDTSAELFVEVVAGGAGRVAALLSGELPLSLVEACEEVGVELVPYSGELGWTCSCDAWVDPCPHGLAVSVQVGWLLQADPLVLLHLRGLSRDDLLARVHAVTDSHVAGRAAAGHDGQPATGQPPAARPPAARPGEGRLEDDLLDEDLETGLDAALRAASLLADLGTPSGEP